MSPAKFAAVLFCAALASAQTVTERERALLDRIEQLERRMAALEARSVPPPAVPDPVPAAQPSTVEFAPGATLNLYLDGYYGWNFNRPAARTNVLRFNDTLANNFTLNQASLILERAADPSAGRRFGARVDLMFGQDTESFQGSPANEPRPSVYRHLFQAYGTYVAPLGRGLTVDFGKFASALGFENNYAWHEVNYSRSLFFDALPSYHMGFRAAYAFSDRVTAQYWLVNGVNQTEDFNGFKSNALLLTVKPVKTVSWNLNYCYGRESRVGNALTRIFDSYVSWTPTGSLTLAVEGDRIASAAAWIGGGAAYAQYRFTPRWALGGRVEYLRDRGGLFSGADQSLKEHTLTLTYQPAVGVQFRGEYRRDFSDRPFFPTAREGALKREQNTATLGLIWWLGGKRDSW